jgi:hypothetical protein
MRLMRRFLQLSTEERVLLARAGLALLFVRLWLPVAKLDRLERWAHPAMGRPRSLMHTVWAVRTAARLVPGTGCLPAALVLQRLLASAGHASELHIGVAHESGRFAAHAWVSRAGEVLIGEATETPYASLLSWR